MAAYNFSDLKVLVVEDNEHFRLLIRTILQTFGISGIEEAKDGADAIAKLRYFPADLAILDWKMERMDGIVFAHKVRRGSDSPNPFLPIIMVTGYTDANLMAEARDAGVNEFLAKPISAKGLVSRIVACVHRPRQFVRTGTYFGPDRRRRQSEYQGEDRRSFVQGDEKGKIAE